MNLEAIKTALKSHSAPMGVAVELTVKPDGSLRAVWGGIFGVLKPDVANEDPKCVAVRLFPNVAEPLPGGLGATVNHWLKRRNDFESMLRRAYDEGVQFGVPAVFTRDFIETFSERQLLMFAGYFNSWTRIYELALDRVEFFPPRKEKAQ